MDDLSINSETLYHSRSKDLLRAVKENPDNEFYAKTIGQLLYHMGKDGIYDEAVIKKIEKCLYKFKGEFPKDQLLVLFMDFYPFLQIINICMISLMLNFVCIKEKERIGKNKNLQRKYRSQCHNCIIRQYRRHLKYQTDVQLRLLHACISAKYFEPDMFDNLVKDTDEGRYRTMDELKAVRENAPKQYIGDHLYQPEMLEQYLKLKVLGNNEAIQREKRLIQEKQLDDLLYDQFMLNKVEQQRDKEQQIKDNRKGMKDEDGQDEDEEIDNQLTEEERKDLLTDFQKKHFESLDMETVNPDDLPPEWFMDNNQSKDNDFDEMDERIQQAAQEKSQFAKNKELKKRKGRSGKGDIFNAME
ncbi:unnamed protein product [Paramecium sonneborni]|uniref:Uncharacterized protein n=1 Tax=Paramecium sonneborni TaxID=65129 RepID=A0A8S1L851_9CILI|nr:unnamed protein product [Paramecium sonneborni]